MEIIKHYKDYKKLATDLNKVVGSQTNRHIKVRCYTSEENNTITTDLEIEVYSGSHSYLSSITVMSVETKSSKNWDATMNEQRQAVASEKQKIYEYLSEKFLNVDLCPDYSQ